MLRPNQREARKLFRLAKRVNPSFTKHGHITNFVTFTTPWSQSLTTRSFRSFSNGDSNSLLRFYSNLHPENSETKTNIIDRMDFQPSIFVDLKNMCLQECDRPKCMSIELSKIGVCVVTTPDYDTMYVWPISTPEHSIVSWHRDNNAGDSLLFHVSNRILNVEMPE